MFKTDQFCACTYPAHVHICFQNCINIIILRLLSFNNIQQVKSYVVTNNTPNCRNLLRFASSVEHQQISIFEAHPHIP